MDELGRRYFLPNIAISITQGLLHLVLYRALVLLVGSDEAPRFHDGLTSYCDTKTNLVNRDLYRLYQTIKRIAGTRGAPRPQEPPGVVGSRRS